MNHSIECTHHHACDCREHAFIQVLALAQDTMEAWASSLDLEEWHCRVEDLIGTAYPKTISPASAGQGTRRTPEPDKHKSAPGHG